MSMLRPSRILLRWRHPMHRRAMGEHRACLGGKKPRPKQRQNRPWEDIQHEYRGARILSGRQPAKKPVSQKNADQSECGK